MGSTRERLWEIVEPWLPCGWQWIGQLAAALEVRPASVVPPPVEAVLIVRFAVLVARLQDGRHI